MEEFMASFVDNKMANLSNHLSEVFGQIDTNKDGIISKEELSYYFENTVIFISGEEIEKILVEMDANKDGTVNMEEFIQYVQKQISNNLEGDLKELRGGMLELVNQNKAK